MTEKAQQSPEEIEQQAFLTGFEDETAANGRHVQPQPSEPEKPEKISEAPKPSTEKPEPRKAAKEKPKDEFVRLTRADYDFLKANAGKVPELEEGLRKANGKFGPITQILNELKSATPKGQAVEVSESVLDEAVAELKAEFPDVASGIKTALKTALKAGLVGTGKGDTAPDEAIKKGFEEYALARAFEDLDEAHPTWREIVGAVHADPANIDQNIPFRVWLAKQPQDYQDKINKTRNPTVTSNAITKFLASQREAAKPAPTKKPVNKAAVRKLASRRNRIQGSVQPKGLGSPPPAQKQSVDDAFNEGFTRG